MVNANREIHRFWKGTRQEEMSQTKIEWADRVWNPVTGCTSISEGCQHCYARRMATRLKGRYGYPKDEPFKVTFHPTRLDDLARWKKGCRVFAVSMGDLFYYGKSPRIEEYHLKQAEIFKTMKHNSHHTYLLLTKRPENMSWWVERWLGWWEEIPSNWWLGVSISNQPDADKNIPILLQIPAAHRWVSVEPMLVPINIAPQALCPCSCFAGNPRRPHPDCEGKPSIDWVVCGGETGPGARPLYPDWVRSLRDQCQAAGVPMFIKTFPVDGKLSNRMDEWPEDLRIREIPNDRQNK
jgi:protein gp37